MHKVAVRVVNLRKEKYDVYIGRPGKGKSGIFGNPVAIGRKCPVCGEVHTDRGSTLPCYRIALYEKLEGDKQFERAFERLVQQLQEKGELVLGCFCKPYPCHGDVLAEVLLQHFCKCGWYPCNPVEHAGWCP